MQTTKRQQTGKAGEEEIRGDARTLKIYSGEREILIEPSQHLRIHSFEFNWGYSGSGPAQLALALLLDASLEPEHAQRHYQRFKEQVIAPLPGGKDFRFPRAKLLSWVQAVRPAATAESVPDPSG